MRLHPPTEEEWKKTMLFKSAAMSGAMFHIKLRQTNSNWDAKKLQSQTFLGSPQEDDCSCLKVCYNGSQASVDRITQDLVHVAKPLETGKLPDFLRRDHHNRRKLRGHCSMKGLEVSYVFEVRGTS